ncbi:MAG TPA: hypothetical protein VN541_16030 [Tepidisphaeraceae bacterium]|nr:hypothetical protein [Tepidisphaeraceae bacterium]
MANALDLRRIFSVGRCGAGYMIESLEDRCLLSATSSVQASLVQPLAAISTQASAPEMQPANTTDTPVYAIGDPITAQAGGSFEAEATVTNTTGYNFFSPNQFILTGSVLSQLILSKDNTLFNGPGVVGQTTDYVNVPPLQSTFWIVPDQPPS